MSRENYHLSQIATVSVGTDDDNKPRLEVTLRPDAQASPQFAPLTFLCVIDGRYAYMPEDESSPDDYRWFADDFNQFWKRP